MKEDGIACQHKGCKCHVAEVEAVMYQQQTYCTQRCADGRGCDHEGCNCGAFPTTEPEL